jgi:hypothetical protein
MGCAVRPPTLPRRHPIVAARCTVILGCTLFLSVGGLMGGRGIGLPPAGHVAAHGRAAPLGAEQNTDCPRLDTPGKLLWSFPTQAGVASAPAIGNDGRLAFGTLHGWIFILSCRGDERWSLDTLDGNGVFVGSPVMHTDGTLYFGLGNNSQGKLYAVAAQDGATHSTDLIEPIGASLVVDSEDRIFVGTRHLRQSTGTIGSLGRNLQPLPGFPIRSNPIGAAPVLLSGNRVVIASQPNPRAATVPTDGTPTPKPISPIRRTPTSAPTDVAAPTTTPTDLASSTPAITDTPSASGTPSASASATATPTSQSSATAPTNRWSVFLPLVHSGSARDAADGAVGGNARGVATAHSAGPTRSRPDQPTSLPPRGPSAPTPSPVPGSQESLLHIITDAQAPGKAFKLRDGAATSVIATGEVVIVTLAEQPPRMVAIAVDSDPPRLLWEHFTSGTIAGSPVLGLLVPATGRVELVYADSSGILVSLEVPGTPQAEGGPTFNWAIQLDTPARGAPVLGDAGMLYVATATKVHAFSRTDGGDGWTFDWTGGVSGDSFTGALSLAPTGALLAGTQRAIIAISTESRGLDPNARWPAQRRDNRNSGQAMP